MRVEFYNADVEFSLIYRHSRQWAVGQRRRTALLGAVSAATSDIILMISGARDTESPS